MQPHASELEEAIIGACLIEQEALPLVADKLRPEMFYDDHHQLIFAALIAMYQANKKIDILTVKEELTRRGVLEKIGGPYTIVQLSSRVADVSVFGTHLHFLQNVSNLPIPSEKVARRSAAFLSGELLFLQRKK